MKLVFYSGGTAKQNKILDHELWKLVSNKKNPSFSFIPASSYLSEVDFESYVDQFSSLGVTRFLHFPVDVPFDQTMLREVFKSDVIHLGGGNTFHFLKFLRKNKLFPQLKRFVKSGGVLTGLSAGAIIMTPDILTAEHPWFDRDENLDQVKNLKSLGLVSFDFFPHYKNSVRYDLELKKLSKLTKRPLYACPDGAGIIMNEKRLSFVGRCWAFHLGKKMLLNK